MVHVFPSFARGGRRRSAVGGLGDAFSHKVISLDGELSAREAFCGEDCRSRGVRKEIGGCQPFQHSQPHRKDSRRDILCTYNFGSLEAAIANRFGPKLPHCHFEDGFGPDESLTKQKAKRVLMHAALCSRKRHNCPSYGLEALAKERWGLKRVRRIANGIDTARFASAARALRDGCPVVGSVGALRPEKNYRRLIAAFASGR
ncbi:MAG: hypothetical protein R3C54_12055 [Parvularculaceae bacterium]